MSEGVRSSVFGVSQFWPLRTFGLIGEMSDLLTKADIET
jgi:hypothetical protein